MTRNSDALFPQVRDYPDDLTLLSAYADALVEDGFETRAERVRELLEVCRAILDPASDPDLHRLTSRRYILRRRLGILPLVYGDLVTVDENGVVIPFIAADRDSPMVPVGTVQGVRADGMVDVRITVAYGYPIGQRSVLWR